MKTIKEIKTIICRKNADLKEKYGLRMVEIFGSYARGEQQSESDIDLLVEILKPISLLELVGAEMYLSEILGVKVELVPKRSVKEEARKTISREAVAI